MVKVGIIGATGYAGSKIISLLIGRKEVELVYLASHSYAGKPFSAIYPAYRGVCDLILMEDDLEKAAEVSDLIFLSLPHQIATNKVNKKILSKCKIIDLGADFRLKDVNVYEEYYKCKHGSRELLEEAVYGLCEINREKIKSARLVANPGCYTTCSILTLYPLLSENLVEDKRIIIDAKSGISGAGRSEKLPSLYCEAAESIKAYGVMTHRHTPEIEEQLSYAAKKEIKIQFTPHLTPMSRGILITAYLEAKQGVSEEDIKRAYEKFYKNEKMIRLIDDLPESRNVKGSNLVDISFRLDKRTGNLIAFGAIDNLIKGAAGQAVQNMNIMFGFDEDSSLKLYADVP